MATLLSDPYPNTIRRKLLFIITILYIIFTILRPHEYLELFKDVAIMPTLMITGLLLFPFYRDNRKGSIQNKLILYFLFAMTISLMFSGWVGGILVVIAKFIPNRREFIVSTVENGGRMCKGL